MNFQDLLEQLSPEIYQRFLRAVEIGKWPDGQPLSREQREICLQAIIAYESRHVPEHERTGYIDRTDKAEGERCGDSPRDTAELKWVE